MTVSVSSNDMPVCIRSKPLPKSESRKEYFIITTRIVQTITDNKVNVKKEILRRFVRFDIRGTLVLFIKQIVLVYINRVCIAYDACGLAVIQLSRRARRVPAYE